MFSGSNIGGIKETQEMMDFCAKHNITSSVEMIKITPAVTACKLTIQLAPAKKGSEATVTYAHTSLGTRGDAFVEAFTAEYYEGFMKQWEAQMNHFLSEGETLRAGAD